MDQTDTHKPDIFSPTQLQARYYFADSVKQRFKPEKKYSSRETKERIHSVYQCVSEISKQNISTPETAKSQYAQSQNSGTCQKICTLISSLRPFHKRTSLIIYVTHMDQLNYVQSKPSPQTSPNKLHQQPLIKLRSVHIIIF